MRRGLKVSCIYIVGLDVSLFYPEILLTYLLLTELFVLRIRSEIKILLSSKQDTEKNRLNKASIHNRTVIDESY